MEIEAFVLIGGRSTRFGTDKAFVEFEGEMLAHRAARVMHLAYPGERVRFVAASKEQFGSRLDELRSPTIFDRKPGHGAWSGLDTALANSIAEWTLVFACDLPFATTALLQKLAAVREEETDVVVPRHLDGPLQPLCALYRTDVARAPVHRFLDGGERLPPLQSLFQIIKATIIQVDDESLRNVNTPADLIYSASRRLSS